MPDCGRLLGSVVVLAASAIGAQAGLPTVIFSNVHSSATSDVPGMPGFKFRPVDTHGILTSGHFGSPHGSPDALSWMFQAFVHSATNGYQVLLVGDGNDGSTSHVVLRSGTPAFFDESINIGAISPDAGLNSDGSFAFSCDTTAPSTSDEIVARWTSQAGFELIARQGVQAPGQPPGIGYGSGTLAVHIHEDQRVSFQSNNLTGAGSASAIFRNIAIDNGEMLARTGVTVPANQYWPPPHVISLLLRYRADATGENYVYSGTLTGGGGDFVALNGSVIAQDDAPLPGGYPGFYVLHQAEDAASISPYGGHYAFRSGADLVVDSGEVVVVDDRVVAAAESPVVPGSAEYWFNTGGFTPFNLNIVNSHGDYVITGAVSGPNGATGVTVLNGLVELLRSRDPVDLNGDGLPNDGAYIYTVNSDAAFLTDDGRFFFTAGLANLAQQPIGQAFMWMRVPHAPDLNCDGAIDFFDIDPFLLALFDEVGYAAAWPECWRITADINRDGDVNFFDIDPFIACLFSACP